MQTGPLGYGLTRNSMTRCAKLRPDERHQLGPEFAVVVPLGRYERRQHVDLTSPCPQVLGLETGATGLRTRVG